KTRPSLSLSAKEDGDDDLASLQREITKARDSLPIRRVSSFATPSGRSRARARRLPSTRLASSISAVVLALGTPSALSAALNADSATSPDPSIGAYPTRSQKLTAD